LRGATALLAILIFAAPVPTPAAAASTDAVVQWNEYATTALIGAAAPFGLQPPPVAVLHLAMVHGAVYDAVNAIEGGYQPYLGAPKAKRSYSTAAAAATAAYKVLIDPTLKIGPTQLAPLAGYYAASLSAIPSGKAKDGGIAVGTAAADNMLKARANDGRFGTFRFTVPASPGPGQWRPTAVPPINDPNAWVARVTPFMIDKPSRFASDGPDALTSERYATEFNEVKAIGRAIGSTRTTEQTNAANFWAQQPAATWSATFRSVAATHGLSTAQSARLFAMLYLTAADALIACWDDKARWLFWRPETAIHEAGNDGNVNTSADASWTPLIPTPPYPDQPSGHACFSSSITHTLGDFFGTDKMSLTVVHVSDGASRIFTRFSGAINEIIDARIWSGLHFRKADVDGANIGKQVAQWRDERFFQRCDRGEEDRGSGEDRGDGDHGGGDGSHGEGCRD
jgi:hypothetical protein